jgi:alpha-tubulin suppressor-like RCC1 family protein
VSGVLREVPALRGATRLAAGTEHTCAIRPDGHVVCIGNARACQLGKLGAFSKTAVEVANVSDAIEISAAGDNTCALLESGRVMCWGDNDAGQLGNGKDDPGYQRHVAGSDCTPSLVQGLDDATVIAVSESHACAVRKTGEVVCWGENRAGQIGDGSRTSRKVPTAVGAVRAVHRL